MPTYELSMVLRVMTRPEIISTLKRTAECIFERGGVIRKLENLGARNLPHKISKHGCVHKEGNYFNIAFDTSPVNITDLNEEFGRDIDIIAKQVFKVDKAPEFECTLHEELLSAAYRKEVQEMIKLAEKKHKPKYNYNSGYDYYPFQK